MATKKRILIFPFNILAHYLRCLVLADEFDKNEYEVLFAYSELYNVFVKQKGYKSFFVKHFNANDALEELANFEFKWLNKPDMEDVLLSQITAIKKLGASMVLGDAVPTLKMASEYCGVKYISVVNGYLSPYYSNYREISRTHKAYPLLKSVPRMMAKLLTIYAERLAFKKIHMPFKMLRKHYRLKPLSSYMDEMQGDEVVICDDPHIFPQKKLPKRYTIIGPLIYQHPLDDPRWLNTLNLIKPTICVCMGSSGDWEKLQFLNDSYYQRYNIISVGDKKGVLRSAHIIAKSFVNLSQVLQFSHLLICHGGNGTTNCGFVERVYMLCISSHMEQEWNIQGLERLGIGKSANDFDAVQWKEEILKVINSRLENLTKVTKRFKELPPIIV